MCIYLSFFFIQLPGKLYAAYDTIVVFGDSISDNGNLYEFFGPLAVSPDYYWRGRFSNGPVWVEYLSDPDKLDANLVNWALGAAQTRGLVPSGFIEQVAYHVSSNDAPSQNTLFILWIGANDYSFGLRDYEDSVGNIQEGLQDLADFGAREFLVLNLPDLGKIPIYIGTSDAADATQFSMNFNNELSHMIQEWRTSNPQIQVYYMDFFSMFSNLCLNSIDAGFTNVTEESPNFSEADNFDNSDGYVFWDERHFTTEMHEWAADKALMTVTESNETIEPSGNDSNETLGQTGNKGKNSCFISSLQPICQNILLSICSSFHNELEYILRH